MLVTMFRAAGLESNPAMTMAGSRIDAVPADQFNHCVTALKLPDGSYRMYDPTWVPYNNSIWSLLEAEQHYVVGDPEGQQLSRIAYSPPVESPLVVKHEAKLSADGTLAGRIRLDGTGALDGRLRGTCNGRKDELVRRWAHWLAPMGRRLEDVTVAHRVTDDFSWNMWVELTYRLPGFALPVGDALEFVSPLNPVLLNDGTLFRAAAHEWDDERDTDVFLYFTQLLDFTETIELPKGWRVAEPPKVDPVDETYAAFAADAAMDGRDLEISQRFEVRRRQIPPDGYAGFKTAVDACRDWGDRIYRAEKGGRR
jgi:hypothetical protein